MKKTMILIMAVATTIKATAQSVTYNHDSSKQNQITVMETGGGSLTPEFYYWLLHNNYKKTAAEKNKLGFRTLAGINLYNQVDDAELSPPWAETFAKASNVPVVIGSLQARRWRRLA